MGFENKAKRRLRDGHAIVGAALTIPSPAAAQIWARSKIDLLAIDMEHSPIDIGTAHDMIVATQGTDAAPIVRVPSRLPWLVQPVLDAGAAGVVFPMVDTAEHAAAAVRSMRYPPEGDRGWGPFFSPLRWGVPMSDYVAAANDQLLTCVLIERRTAVENIREIVAVPGIDLVIIGVYDLAFDLGFGDQPHHPEVQRAVAAIEKAVLPSPVALAGGAATPDAANQLVERGYRCIFLGYDVMILQRAIENITTGIDRNTTRTRSATP